MRRDEGGKGREEREERISENGSTRIAEIEPGAERGSGGRSNQTVLGQDGNVAPGRSNPIGQGAGAEAGEGWFRAASTAHMGSRASPLFHSRARHLLR